MNNNLPEMGSWITGLFSIMIRWLFFVPASGGQAARRGLGQMTEMTGWVTRANDGPAEQQPALTRWKMGGTSRFYSHFFLNISRQTDGRCVLAVVKVAPDQIILHREVSQKVKATQVTLKYYADSCSRYFLQILTFFGIVRHYGSHYSYILC